MRWMRCMTMLALAATVAGCGQPAQVSFGTMCIERLGLDATDYAATLMISNPNAEALKVSEIRWRLTSGDRAIVEKNEVRFVELPGEKTTPVTIHVQVPASSLTAAGLGDCKQFDYQFTGQVHVAGAFGGTALPFVNSGRMPVIQPLVVRLDAIDRVAAGETSVNVIMSFVVANGNVIPLVPTALKGDMFVNNRPLIVLDTPIDSAVAVPAGGTSVVKVPVKISSAEFGVKSLQTLLTAPGTLIRVVAVVSFRGAGEGDVNDMLAGPTTRPE